MTLCAVLVATSGSPAAAPPREAGNVEAFARLYGAVRWFYPSDVAADLDWNRFAVHGVARVRTAPDTETLAATLRSLFGPLGPGILVAAALPPPEPAPAEPRPLVAWQYLGPGFGEGRGAYQARRLGRDVEPVIDGFVTVMRSVPAASLRGGRVRLRGRARARVDGEGWGALWLRVDRESRKRGFFDNMGDRPIRDAFWKEYRVEGPVAGDATEVAFGLMASGAAVADFDAVALETRRGDGPWSPVALEDAGFEADPEASPWFRTGSSSLAVVERPSGEAPEGRRMLRLAPPPAGPAAPLFEDPLPAEGAHVDIELVAGLRARVPIALTADEAGARPDVPGLRALTAALATPTDPDDPATRLADLVVAWNVFRHFYPYTAEAGVDWDEALPALIRDEPGPAEQHRDAVRRLVALARDGHGSVTRSQEDRPSRGRLPLSLRVIEGRVVVAGTATPQRALQGAVVKKIAGEPVSARLERAVELASGSDRWRRVRALRELASGPGGTDASVELEDDAGARTVTLRYGFRRDVPEPRPEPIADLGDGIAYVDLTRARMADLAPELARLATARGVVFDVRGYPTDAGAGILPHLISEPEHTRWMHVPRIAGPFGRWPGWEHAGWDLAPAEPHLGGGRVFLTDERAISYAESVMGYVADLGLGRIVGAPTAGTNGNVKRFSLPSGLSVTFTGMRVTRHDGESTHHLVGVRPDVPLEPTVEGIRAGRDELLERALALLREGA